MDERRGHGRRRETLRPRAAHAAGRVHSARAISEQDDVGRDLDRRRPGSLHIGRARARARDGLGGSLFVVGAGAVLGIAASIGAARLLADRLFGVPPHDARILSAAIAILLTTALIANWLPARRAAAIDPMKSLRAE